MKKSKRQQSFAASAKVREQEKLAKRTMLPVQPARTEVPGPSNEPPPRVAPPDRGNAPPSIEHRDVKPDNVELSPLEAMAAKIRARTAP